MSGWEKVAAATLLAVIGLVGLNVAIWRRMRIGVQSARNARDEPEGVVEQRHAANNPTGSGEEARS